MDNGESVMRITSPDKDKESTYKKTYILSGDSDYSDVVITIAKYNAEEKKYEYMKNTDGESSWDIGEYRLFIKNISLDLGVNKIKIMSYRSSQKQNAEDIQVNCFTIERLNESIAERAVKTTVEIAKDIKNGVDSTYIDSFDKILDFLESHLKEGDLLITMGAGDVYKVGEAFLGR
jgi:hypothetical protein